MSNEVPASPNEAQTPRPEDPGVIPEQRETPPTAVVHVPSDIKVGLEGGELFAGIRDIASAFRSTAVQSLLAHWTYELQRRLEERDRELKQMREELSQERVSRARLEVEGEHLRRRNAAEDLMKIGGGAILGAGVTELIGGRSGIGGILTIVGLLLAGFGVVPSLWRTFRR